MAARLEWKDRHAFGGYLFLGGWQLGAFWRESKKGKREFHYELQNSECTHGGPYESADDAAQDLEAEVRRLLRESGVVVE